MACAHDNPDVPKVVRVAEEVAVPGRCCWQVSFGHTYQKKTQTHCNADCRPKHVLTGAWKFWKASRMVEEPTKEGGKASNTPGRHGNRTQHHIPRVGVPCQITAQR